MTGPRMVVIIEARQSARESLAQILESVGIQTRCFANAQHFLAADLSTESVACVIADTLLPGMSGLELQRRLAAWPVPPPLIVVTAHADMTTAVETMRAGALDFLEAPPRPQVLVDRVYEAFRRFDEALERYRLRCLMHDRYARLTPRERDVMDLVSVGYPNKAVAQRLGVTRKAVEAYRARVMRKMEAESLPMLVRECVVLRGDVQPIGVPRAQDATRESSTRAGHAPRQPGRNGEALTG